MTIRPTIAAKIMEAGREHVNALNWWHEAHVKLTATGDNACSAAEHADLTRSERVWHDTQNLAEGKLKAFALVYSGNAVGQVLRDAQIYCPAFISAIKKA